MVELVDSVDLGSSVLDVQVRVLLPAPSIKAPLWGCFLCFIVGRTRTHQMQQSGGLLLARARPSNTLISSSPVARTNHEEHPFGGALIF